MRLLIEYKCTQDNPQVKYKEKSQNLFPQSDKVRRIHLIVESKSDNLITL